MKKLSYFFLLCAAMMTFTGCNNEPEVTLTENGYEYVDLGLSVKWATMNVGATTPEGYGDYFAWGETTTKNNYNWVLYKYSNDTNTTLTKYCTTSSYGTVDNKTTLELEDDAAHVNWGGNWRMPTAQECLELRQYCTWIWTKQNGVNGYMVQSRLNGKSIFIPASGTRAGQYLMGLDSYAYYWTTTLISDTPDKAFYVYFSWEEEYLYYSERKYGLTIRPVFK